GPAPRRSMDDARHRHRREAVPSDWGVSRHRASALARVHVAAGLAGRCDPEPRAFLSAKEGWGHDPALDAFPPHHRALARKPPGLAANPIVVANTRRRLSRFGTFALA